MNAPSNSRFLKMNGLGNEITVLDLRGSAHRVSAAEARAIATDPRSRFDQLMVLHDPVTPGTDAYMRIYNTDGSESGACGNGTRCVAWAMTADPVMSRPVEGDRSVGEVGPHRCQRGERPVQAGDEQGQRHHRPGLDGSGRGQRASHGVHRECGDGRDESHRRDETLRHHGVVDAGVLEAACPVPEGGLVLP